MLSKTDFKSTITHKVYTLELILNIKTSEIYNNIEHQLLDLLELPLNEYTIVLYSLNNERIEANDETCFANYCDCNKYPAFYFKPILYTDLASNFQSIDTSNLIQQEEPYSESDSDSDSDSIPDLVSCDDADDDDDDENSINNNTLISQ